MTGYVHIDNRSPNSRRRKLSITDSDTEIQGQ